MDTGTKTEENLRQQQLLFAQQLQDDDARLQAEQEPFEDLEWRFHQASAVLMSALRAGKVADGEQTLFDQLEVQYHKRREEEEDKHNKTKLGDVLHGKKRRRDSSSPLFVGQDEPDQDEKYSSVNASTSSKRRRVETSNDLQKGSKTRKMSENVKQSLRRLVADAPANKKQAAIKDSARVLHAIKQFPDDSVRYLGDGMWNIEGIITSVKTHQLLNIGWMIEREASTKGPKGGILADKMGLGKTLCALACMIHGNATVGSKGTRTNIVVVPSSTKDQWMEQAQKHAVQSTSDDMLGLNQIFYYNSQMSSETQKRQLKTADLVVITYNEVGSAFKNVNYPPGMDDEAKKQSYFDEHIRPTLPAIFQAKFRGIYLDEGHQIRNPTTVNALACQKLTGKVHWIFTGTPMTNDPIDLYSELKFIRHPRVLMMTFNRFKAHY